MKLISKGFVLQSSSAVKQSYLDSSSILEGHISKLWQSWSNFNRGVLLEIIGGGTREDGVLITSNYITRTAPEIEFIASQLGRGNTIGTIRPQTTRQHEPTWAYFEVPFRVIAGINSNIEQELLTAFNGQNTLRDLRICRNASAHITSETIQEVRSTQVRYTFNKFRHPTDMCLWIDPTTEDFLWKSWISEMRFISNEIIS